MLRRNTHTDQQRIRCVLADLSFPAAKWQVITHSESYGADATTRSDLWSLPIGTYPDLPAVLAALGLAKAPATRPGYRDASTIRATARELPVRDLSGA